MLKAYIPDIECTICKGTGRVERPKAEIGEWAFDYCHCMTEVGALQHLVQESTVSRRWSAVFTGGKPGSDEERSS